MEVTGRWPLCRGEWEGKGRGERGLRTVLNTHLLVMKRNRVSLAPAWAAGSVIVRVIILFNFISRCLVERWKRCLEQLLTFPRQLLAQSFLFFSLFFLDGFV